MLVRRAFSRATVRPATRGTHAHRYSSCAIEGAFSSAVALQHNASVAQSDCTQPSDSTVLSPRVVAFPGTFDCRRRQSALEPGLRQPVGQRRARYGRTGCPVSVCVERRDDHASVRVQDRGIGIDLTMLPRISICASRRTARSIVRKGLSACPLSRSQSENENNSVLTEAGAPGVNQTVS
jgi:hypothetical protein